MKKNEREDKKLKVGEQLLGGSKEVEKYLIFESMK